MAEEKPEPLQINSNFQLVGDKIRFTCPNCKHSRDYETMGTCIDKAAHHLKIFHRIKLVLR